jgi:hypothetical protein
MITDTIQEGVYYRSGETPGKFFNILFLSLAPDYDSDLAITCLKKLWVL